MSPNHSSLSLHSRIAGTALVVAIAIELAFRAWFLLGFNSQLWYYSNVDSPTWDLVLFTWLGWIREISWGIAAVAGFLYLRGLHLAIAQVARDLETLRLEQPPRIHSPRAEPIEGSANR